ncbi:hypothetical protein [Rheinheimera maricola]|uniref:Peptidase n=1 Tax=Rheinheimera maricola TaxID=2793282 RepID=A0ABS7X6Q2_9GAMM|nr:hypothetical protein [Rheinheimera maricola]MBZ9610800.1 hypothetical protein [Rheinheimera maricola]
MPKLLEIFKSGKRTDSQGREWDGDSIINEVIREYDPAVFAAPLVIGHPGMDAPAYGLVKSLSLDKTILQAEPMDVEPQFAEMVNNKRFPKISSSFFTPDNPANPTPGKWYLRHVGFLGAAAPAVPGLKMAQFAADDDVVTIEFAASDLEVLWSLSRLARGMRDWMLEKFGAEEADRALPDYVVQGLENQREREFIAEEPSPGFAAPQQQPEVPNVDPNEKAKQEQQAADFAAREAKLAQRELAIKTAEAKARREELACFCESQVVAGKLLPAEKDAMVSFMASVNDSETVSFAAADGDVKTPAGEWFKGFLQALPVRVDFSERGADAGTADFANDATAMAKAAGQYQAEMAAKGVTVSATDAVKHVNGAKQ